MSYFTAETIRRLLSPNHELSCSWFLWRRIVRKLRTYCTENRSESGAFLLGRTVESSSQILDFVLYDDLDPNSLESGIVRFDGSYYGTLWEICHSREMKVVADIHVHLFDSNQSDSDRAYPMISKAGHLALILPHFARGRQPRHDIGIYRYLGSKQWQTIAPNSRRSFFYIGIP